MKTLMKLIATLAAASILAGCQTMANYNTGNAGRFGQYDCSGSAPAMPDENTMIFRPAKQTCGGSTFGQRNEIVGNIFPQSQKKKLVMTANVAIDADITVNKYGREQSRKTTLFQVASMTKGCNPAASFFITNTRGTVTKTGYTHRKGANRSNINATCTHGYSRGQQGSGDGETPIPMNGTQFDLKVEFDFKGKGDFDYIVYMNGERINTFSHIRPAISTSNKEYALKFGLYSPEWFDYTMTVKNFRVDKVDKLSDEFYATFDQS